MTDSEPDKASPAGDSRSRVRRIVILYPFAIAIVGLAINLVVFGVSPLDISVPGRFVFAMLTIAFVLLVINHAWLMTTTELTRLKYQLRTTPEEWRESDLDPAQASPEGIAELERRHNAHRNTTENVVYFAPLALLFAFASPPVAASVVWLAGFGLARLGYTYAYLSRNTSLRGVCMTLSLLSLFGLAGYLAVALGFAFAWF